MSTSQARISLDGPLGSSGAGFLASVRKSYPSWYAPHDPTYLSGQTEDALMKLEAPVLSGSLRVLYYEMGNSIGTATRAAASGPLRDGFDWGSRSVGMRWSRRTGVGTIQLQGWAAGLETEATWLGSSAVGLSSRRDDFGLQALVERSGSASSTLAGVRYEWSRTGYSAESLDGGGPRLQLGARTPAATGFLQHQRGLGRGITADAALSTTAAAAGVFLDLQGGIHYRLSRSLTLSAAYVRAHQFAQSLRNSESVVGNIFPAELYVGAGNREVPVARNDRGILALDYRPSAGFRIGAQGYLSRSTGLLLVAPATGEPFATSGFSTGSGTAPGVSLDATLRGSRFGLLANVSWQRVRLWYGDSSYQPAYADGRSFQLGGTMFPTATSSIKLALTGADGRRATGVAGDFEWEACNLVDQGCEFSGTPQSNGALGGTRLPGYLRLDLGVRQHWHLHLGQRDMMVAVYGTFSNLLGRSNILNIITDPATGSRSAIQMRPRAPLVVGTDWHF